MVYQLSPASLQKLSGVHVDLQRLVQALATLGVPILVVEGWRDEAAQQKAYATGRSKEQWPNSKHNKVPSLAVDLSPIPYDSMADKQMYFFAGLVLGVARQMNLPVRWGGDWKQSWNVYLNGPFNDLYHFELTEHQNQGLEQPVSQEDY